MGPRNFGLVPGDDDDEPNESGTPKKRQQSSIESKNSDQKRRKVSSFVENEGEGEESNSYNDNVNREKESNEESQDSRSGGEDEEEAEEVNAKPIGDAVRVTGKGRGRRMHYEAFEFDGEEYGLEDPVLLTPEEGNQKPYVAIIKDISQTSEGSLFVKGQWFYRPEEAEKKGGGRWKSCDARELFYSFHQDEVPAESVMHRCVVHFVLLNKQLPSRKEHPGFIVQKVYDTVQKRLWWLTDEDYEDDKQQEIELLVQKALSHLGDLPDVETEKPVADKEDPIKTKRHLREKNVSPLDISSSEEPEGRIDQHLKEIAGICPSNASEYYDILCKLRALTGDSHRDRWVEKLLRAVQHVFCPADGVSKDAEGKGGSKGINAWGQCKDTGIVNRSNEKTNMFICWPDSAVMAVYALEKVSHETFSSDFQKYNQKMRSLVFNLQKNVLLARRLINGELQPSKILNMSPNELKDGLTADEIARKESDETERMQMTDACCSRCNMFKVGLRYIIQAGNGDRYQSECIACGHSCYASVDEASLLTMEGPSSAVCVGTAPLATSKFEKVAKKMGSSKKSALQ